MGLYERLLQDAAQEEEKERENPEREEKRRRRAYKRQRMQSYISSRRRPVLGGGYVNSQEIKEEQERHLADLRTLEGLVSAGVRSFGAGYRLAWLRRRMHLVEYAHLRNIEISSE